MERILAERYPKSKVHFIRYTDDFIVTTPTKEIAEEARDITQGFLAERGLELSMEKTVITHTDDGFDFLGYNFRKYSGKLLIKPSQKSSEGITDTIRRTVEKAQAWTQDAFIKALNPITRGWTNYHHHNADAETFKKQDAYIWKATWRWGRRKHPDKGRRWIVRRYWQPEGNRKWVFQQRRTNSGNSRMQRSEDTHAPNSMRTHNSTGNTSCRGGTP